MFREFLRSTELIKPKYIIGENVKGLVKRENVDGDLYIDIIKNEFNTRNYFNSQVFFEFTKIFYSSPVTKSY